MTNYYVIVRRLADESVVSKLGPMSERNSDRVYDGLSANLNHDKYYIDIKPEDEMPAEELTSR
jgi:hypothetical protein